MDKLMVILATWDRGTIVLKVTKASTEVRTGLSHFLDIKVDYFKEKVCIVTTLGVSISNTNPVGTKYAYMILGI